MANIQFSTEDLRTPESLERVLRLFESAIGKAAVSGPAMPSLQQLVDSLAPILQQQLQVTGSAPLNLQSLIPSALASPLTTKGDVWGYNTADARIPIGADTAVLKADSTQTLGLKWEQVKETEVTFTDNTTNDVSITKHGYAPKAPNDATKFLDGTGAYSTPSGSGGDLVKLASTDLGSATTTVSFTSISGSYRNLLLLFNARSTAAVTDDIILFQLNADTSANYDWHYLDATNTITSTPFGGTTNGRLADCPGASAAASRVAAVRVDIPAYAATTFHKALIAQSGYYRGGAANQYHIQLSENHWNSANAITQIDLFLATGGAQFTTGCSFTLYGLT